MPKNKFRKKIERNNKIAASAISFSGYGVILSIIALFVFLLYETIPLFYSADVSKELSLQSKSNSKIIYSGIDQYKEICYLINKNGIVQFYNIKDKTIFRRDTIPLHNNEKISAVSVSNYSPDNIAVGTNFGDILNITIKFKSIFAKGNRTILPSFSIGEIFNVNQSDIPSKIYNISFDTNDDGIKYWVWTDPGKNLHLRIYDSDEEQNYSYNLTEQTGILDFSAVAVDGENQVLIAGNKSGELFYFDISDAEEPELKDNWKGSDNSITKLAFLIGGNTIIVGDAKGKVESWFQVRKMDNQLHYSPIHQFKNHHSAITDIIASRRNRSFLTIGRKGTVHLNFSTTAQTQYEFKMDSHSIAVANFYPKSDGIVLIDSENMLGLYNLDDAHPEATFKSLFGKVQYEGYNKTEFVWQSTGGSDSFEPKFSLVPLIFGTLKGTFFAMIFSIPIALLGAIFVSQFASPRLSKIVKPVIEVMAALPSVVIGFLAGLYFSPLFEQNLMLLFLLTIVAPLLLLFGISFYGLIPERNRRQYPNWVEPIFVLLLMIAVYLFTSSLTLPIEQSLFAGNFKQWLYDTLKITYDQRNSIVVGFALGFAVIPIIFTIAEDALSNVPDSLSSASLALGASKWQTVIKVVFPAAAGGIFSAVMLGIGRAIGETMIVLMATGNTPIMSLSPFDGFRTLSANIAVEIPEAPVDGTLYRVLFLTALLLLIFTFLINTVASFVGDKLRKKYARF